MGRRVLCPDSMPYQTDFKLWLEGRWLHGGVAVVRAGRIKRRIKLSRKSFAVLAALVVRAKHDQSRLIGKPWIARGYLMRDEIVRHAKLLGAVTLEPSRIAKIVRNLREKLARLFTDRKGGLRWAKKALEFQDGLGYRLSTLPTNLHLHIINDLPMTGSD